ncbi:site-2 protease family protein [Arthrobacter agilis]|uniref:site-2 protease family protein n=1 Tax=Arthrobacter agilis TaxID=37921 RepID=UPI000B359558|nr:site-2 protease family protein [Arthrobacter agilis]OUM44479.1 site-2 protease family protein [Arthrobacter agilis]PPB47383.1 site-2 protease family protein [Arthrobacter agilis]TPV22827.1 site-2 protease family protein [Arthrobacter agilis]VDR32078.1 Zn-dependent proteases [Arthrobacter agilis]
MTATPPARAERSPGLSLGRIAGIPVVLAWSWFVVTVFIVLVFGPRVTNAFPGIGLGAYAVALGYALLLAASVLIHELAHALTARSFGWPTTRIVLNLWGGHTQFASFNASPGRSLLVALAGPAANFVLAALGWGLLQTMTPGTVTYLLATILVWANLLVAVFNVLPGLPLDGGRLVESAVWKATGSQEKGTVAAGWAGRIIVILLLGLVIGLPLAQGRGPDLTVILLAVVMGAFLWMGATAAIENAKMRLRLPRISAGRLQQRAVGLPAGTTVLAARRLLREQPGAAVVLTGPSGIPEAVVDEPALRAVPEEVAGSTSVDAAARRLAAGAYVPESAEGQELVQFLARLEGNEYAVVDRRGVVTGVLHQRTVVRAITGKNAPGA